MNKEFKIGKYRRNEAKIFTGRDKGIEARTDFDLDSLDEEEVTVYILIPTDTWGINPSFFGGLFEGSIKKLGEKFSDKYKFLYTNKNDLKESLRKDISNDIDYVIRNISVDE